MEDGRSMPDQRTRILDATLGLMARDGSRGTSMRAVAQAIGCNVATLYHYFPSKRDLCQAAIAHRLAASSAFAHPFPEGLAGTVEQRLGALLDDFFANMTAQADLWRVLLAEAIYGDDDVLQPLLDTSALFEAALADWIRTLIPEAPALHQPEVVRTLRHALYGVMVEYLPQPEGRRDALRERARALAAVFAAVQPPIPEADNP
jgi:AcrR family transcriptional regulator